jgi:hypothetical protein
MAEEKQPLDSPKDEQPNKEEQEVFKSKFVTLLSYVNKQGFKPSDFLHTSQSTINAICAGRMKPTFFMKWRLEKAFSKITYKMLSDSNATLPENEDYGFEQRTAKLRYLDKYLTQNADGLTLARALSLSLPKWHRLDSGFDIPSKSIMRKAAVYFSLPSKMLLDDEEKLPEYSELSIDGDLAAIQRNDLTETMNYYKNKHYITRNYRVLSHASRTKLYLSLLLILVPLVAFTGYSAYTIINDRQSSLAKFANNSVDSTSQKFIDGSATSADPWAGYIKDHTKDATNSQGLTYCDVKLGVQVAKIFDIQPSNEYFSVAMEAWFDFNQGDFHKMYTTYKSDTTKDADAASHDSAASAHGPYVYKQDNDMFMVDPSTNAVTYGADSIPDYLELATPFDLADLVQDGIYGLTDAAKIQEAARKVLADSANVQYLKIRNGWEGERLSYPGLFPTTIKNQYSPNFDVGKGLDPTAFTYFYAPGEPYYLQSSKTGAREYRMFQHVKFAVKVSKAYDNPRYPLETAQFWINITPTDWLNVDNLRYVAADVVDVSRDQAGKVNGDYDYCSIDELTYTTMGSDVAFTDGFRSIKNKNYASHAEMIEYNVNKDAPRQSHSKYTIVVRANRAAFTASNFLPMTFLQVYINLAAVIIWIIIGFYNQTYAGEDSLGMLGTGMFSAISATIVGFRMLSDASMFSLLTMLNVFTLAVILIMTYQAVQAKRAQAQKDKAKIAYNGVKLRIMFYILTICTVIMFIGLPIAAYIWTV